MVLGRLEQDDEVVRTPQPGFVVRKWPPALKERSTKGVRDAFFASPDGAFCNGSILLLDGGMRASLRAGAVANPAAAEGA